MDPSALTLTAAVQLLKSGALSSLELIQHFLSAIQKDQNHPTPLNAVIHTDLATAKAQLKNASKNSLLAGAPLLIKANMNLKGYPVDCASKILQGYRSPYTGGMAEKLLANGGVVFGSANLDEFAMGSSNETSVHGLTRNPLNRAYIPGGSSGGPAAAVAGGQALASLGSDTGGSIRQPAACCGLVGLKPTYGRVSRYGLVAFASSFDQIGPLTKTVADAALLLQAIAGCDPKDSTSAQEEVPDFSARLETPLKGRTIGLPKEYFPAANAAGKEGLHPEVAAAVEQVIAFYRQAGCVFKEVTLPLTNYCIPIYYILATAEASANLARYDGVRYGRRSPAARELKEVFFKSRSEGFGAEVKRRLLMGTYVLSAGYYDAYYHKAQQARHLVRQEYLQALKQVDFLLTPTTPYRIFKLGERLEDPVSMYLSDIFTVSANVTGLPALSIPCAKDSNGMPISFQLIGKPFDEASLLNAGHVFTKEHFPVSFLASFAAL